MGHINLMVLWILAVRKFTLFWFLVVYLDDPNSQHYETILDITVFICSAPYLNTEYQNQHGPPL